MVRSVVIAAICLLSPMLLPGGEINPQLSADPAVARILAELGDNSLAVLPKTKIVGEFNELAKTYLLDRRGPGARDFTIKMLWIPERNRAFFCGANHGAPHRLNDAWEFDLAANAWQLLYAPDFNDGRTGREFNSPVVVKDGVLQTTRGGPVHVAHTWWQITYDPLRKRVLWMCCWPGQQRLHELYDVPRDDLFTGPPLWSFDPATSRWGFVKSTSDENLYAGGTSLEYVPELHGVIYQGRRLLPSDGNAWKPLSPQGSAEDFPVIESVLAYDSERRVLVAHKGVPEDYRGKKHDPTKRTWHYDVAENAWKLVCESAVGPNGHDAWTPCGYDPVGKAVLIWDRLDQGKIWAYSVEKQAWTLMTPRGDAMPALGASCGYFDPARNVFVLISGTTTVVYRYRKA